MQNAIGFPTTADYASADADRALRKLNDMKTIILEIQRELVRFEKRISQLEARQRSKS